MRGRGGGQEVVKMRDALLGSSSVVNGGTGGDVHPFDHRRHSVGSAPPSLPNSHPPSPAKKKQMYSHDMDFDSDEEGYMYLGNQGKVSPSLEASAETLLPKKLVVRPPENWILQSLSVVFIFIPGAITFGVLNRVFFRMMQRESENFLIFTGFLTTVIYFPVFLFLLLAWARKYTSEESRSVSKTHFAVIGFLDALQVMLMMMSYETSGQKQTVFSQCSLPLTLILSLIFLKPKGHRWSFHLKHSYKPWHHIGAALVTIGVIVFAIPVMLDRFKYYSPALAQSVSIHNVTFLAACVPGALSSVYKEITFRGIYMNEVFMYTFVSAYQTIFYVVLSPLAAPILDISVKELPQSFADGFRCVLLQENTDGGDNCAASAMFTAAYLSSNMMYNICLAGMLKYSKSIIGVHLANTAVVPIAVGLFSSGLFPRKYTSSLSWFDLIGIVIVMLGLVVYRLMCSCSIRHPNSPVRTTPYHFVGGACSDHIPIPEPDEGSSGVDQETMGNRSLQRIREDFLHRIGIFPAPIIPKNTLEDQFAYRRV